MESEGKLEEIILQSMTGYCKALQDIVGQLQGSFFESEGDLKIKENPLARRCKALQDIASHCRALQRTPYIILKESQRNPLRFMETH